MSGRDCTAVALVLLCVVMSACGGSNEREADLRIERPAGGGRDLIVAIVEGLERHMGEDYEREAEVLRSAARGQRAIYALEWTTREVNNGGWHQFFWNSSGALTDEAIAGARLIGAGENATILREAAAVYPRGEVPEDRAERQRIVDSLSEAEIERVFGPLERRWYARDLELERLMVAYVEAHPDEFFR
jgi:Domain of unknown function (DUF4375)